MSRQISQTVCEFSELSEKAKERAKQDYAEHSGYAWSDDSLKSLKSLAEYFGGKLSDYSIDFFASSPSYARFDLPELTRAEIRVKMKGLGKYNRKTGKGHGECVLTGYCMDESAIDGLRKGIRAGKPLDESFQMAFATWLKDCQDDCESFYDDSNFSEHCDANGYEFLENGHWA